MMFSKSYFRLKIYKMSFSIVTTLNIFLQILSPVLFYPQTGDTPKFYKYAAV